MTLFSDNNSGPAVVRYPQAAPLPDPSDLFREVIPYVNVTPGEQLEGYVEDMKTRHLCEWVTSSHTFGDPLFYRDGSPRLEVILTVKVVACNAEGYDGNERVQFSVRVNGPLHKAIRAAGRLEVGAKIIVACTGLEPKRKGQNNPPKIWEVTVIPTDGANPGIGYADTDSQADDAEPL